MSTTTTYLNDELYQYLQKASLREPDILQELRDVTSTMSASEMQIAPEQGQFMRLIAQLMGAKRTIEVGVYTGYSALSVALALPDDGELIACDINEEWTLLAKEFWEKAGVGHKIKLHIAPATETLDKLIADGQQASFDFAFIDADKINYSKYYEQCLQLIRSGGLIMLDNMLWSGKVVDHNSTEGATQTIRAMNAKLLTDDRVNISLVPIGDGVSLALKK